MRRKIVFLSFVILIALTNRLYAKPMTYSQSLDFNAPAQSLWGPGSSYADFYTSGKVGDSAGIKYKVEASSGTVTSDFNGVLSVDYNDYLPHPGTTYLNIGFTGNSNGGLLDTDLSASIDVDWFVDWYITRSGDLYSKDYTLDIDKQFTPELDTFISGSDNFTAVNINKSIPPVEAGLDFDIEQEANFTADSIDGLLFYQSRRGGITGITPFLIDTDLDISLPINLPQSGLWDLYFTDMDLINEFSTGFDLDIIPYIEVDLLLKDKRWDWKLLDIDLYDTPPFPLAFNQINDLPTFQIYVTPEPSTLLLLFSGLVGLAGLRRRG